jgi:AraC-like DNA-binding protein
LAALQPDVGESSAGPGLLVRRFRMALQDHFPRMLEVRQYAEMLQVSRSHLNAHLRRETGRSPSEIIHEHIALEAKRLLVHSPLTVSEIAYRLGFRDPSYFCRFFRKASGQAPLGFRSEAREVLLAG